MIVPRSGGFRKIKRKRVRLNTSSQVYFLRRLLLLVNPRLVFSRDKATALRYRPDAMKRHYVSYQIALDLL